MLLSLRYTDSDKPAEPKLEPLDIGPVKSCTAEVKRNLESADVEPTKREPARFELLSEVADFHVSEAARERAR